MIGSPIPPTADTTWSQTPTYLGTCHVASVDGTEAALLTDDDAWKTRKGQMLVIYNQTLS